MRLPALRSFLVLAVVVAVLAPLPALAHCDTLDGPVVAAAKRALDTGNPAYALVWVKPAAENELLAAFRTARGAHDAGERAFFETLVRLHRAGEGAPYTGLKPAGTDLGPAIPAADAAIASGNVDPLTALLAETLQRGVADRYHDVLAKRDYAPNDVAAGRAYVESYVSFVHYVEAVYGALQASPEGHYAEPAPAARTATAALCPAGI